MTIGQRIRLLRMQNGMNQLELSQKINVHHKQISAYERDINLPSTEIMMKLSEVFNVSLDYLAFDSNAQPPKINIKDRELLSKFETIDNLPLPEKNLAKQMLDLLILKHKFHELVDTSST